ncbi:hypothetical protein C0993_007534 [Termitomyces sp. T159_Od127]|nr:hypothetical protein C0993_007534 [Termitomyces sp. T159_Od127]
MACVCSVHTMEWPASSRCSMSQLWQTLYVAAKQGWSLEWVQEQMESHSRLWAVMAAAREGGLHPREAEEGQSELEKELSGSEEEEESALAPFHLSGTTAWKAVAVGSSVGQVVGLPIARGAAKQEAPWQHVDGGSPRDPHLLADLGASSALSARDHEAEPAGIHRGFAPAPSGGACALGLAAG